MNKLAVIICNYNGSDLLEECLESIYRQTMKGFDVFVVDNASTDASVAMVKDKFPDTELILNTQNLGGTGGFNRGMQICIRRGYQYLMLLDNDAFLADDALDKLYRRICGRQDVAAVGSKIMIKDAPQYIQEYGSSIDFKHFTHVLGFQYEEDGKDLPEMISCDYIPACAAMFRADVLRETELMPEDTFIYWDDIELCYRIKIKGYKIFSIGDAYAWHRGGYKRPVINTFGKYYFFRNRLQFFAKYLPEGEEDEFSDFVVREFLQRQYGGYSKKMNNTLVSTMYAFEDFLNGLRGNAEQNRILPADQEEDLLLDLLKRAGQTCLIIADITESRQENMTIVYWMISKIVKSCPGLTVWVSLENISGGGDEYRERYIRYVDASVDKVLFVKNSANLEVDITLKMCKHVTEVTKNILPAIYVDRHLNSITSEKEWDYFYSYRKVLPVMKQMYVERVKEQIRIIKGGANQNI